MCYTSDSEIELLISIITGELAILFGIEIKDAFHLSFNANISMTIVFINFISRFVFSTFKWKDSMVLME